MGSSLMNRSRQTTELLQDREQQTYALLGYITVSIFRAQAIQKILGLELCRKRNQNLLSTTRMNGKE